MNRAYEKEVESTCDYSLPDYMGDLKKLLCVSARPIPSARFPSEDSVEYSGVVEYSALYADSDGKLTSITTSSDYDLSIPAGEGYKDSDGRVRLASVSTRVAGPRKISFRSQLALRSDVVSEDIPPLSGGGAEREDLEALSSSVQVEEAIFASLPEREYAEEAARLDGAYADDVEIIASSGAVRIIESVVEEGAVVVKGELIISVILRTSEQPPYAIRKVIPFEERITREEITTDMEAISKASLSSVRAAVSEDGESAVITVNAISDLSAALYKNESVSVVKDAYLRDSDYDLKLEKRVFSERLYTASGEEKIVHTVPRGEIGLDGVREILKLHADANITEKSIEDDGVRILGNIAIGGVACEINPDSSISYIPIRINAPMNVFVKSGCRFDEDCEIDAVVTPFEVESAIDQDRLRLTVGLHIDTSVRRSREVRCVAECNPVAGDASVPRRSVITVYYPDSGETLFDVAKAFRSTVARIALDNSLTESVYKSAETVLSDIGAKSLIIT